MGGTRQRVQRPQAIRKRADFLAANSGLRTANRGFVLLAKPNGGRGKRYGVTVTKRIGNAVVRNRMKRRFRELLWDALPAYGLADHDHILIGREAGVERDFSVMQTELQQALERLAAGKGDQRRRRGGQRGKKNAGGHETPGRHSTLHAAPKVMASCRAGDGETASNKTNDLP